MTKTNHSIVTKQKLQEIALQLFHQKGYEKTSVELIVKKSGVSKGAFYHHFKSKDEILESLAEQYAKNMAQAAQAVAEQKNLGAVAKLNLALSKDQQYKFINLGQLLQIHCIIKQNRDQIFENKLIEKGLVIAGKPFVKIIKQGVAEKVFNTQYPEEIVELIIRTISHMHDDIDMLAQDSKRQSQNFTAIKKKIAFVEEMINRILDVKRGSIDLGCRRIVDLYKKFAN